MENLDGKVSVTCRAFCYNYGEQVVEVQKSQQNLYRSHESSLLLNLNRKLNYNWEVITLISGKNKDFNEDFANYLEQFIIQNDISNFVNHDNHEVRIPFCNTFNKLGWLIWLSTVIGWLTVVAEVALTFYYHDTLENRITWHSG